MDAIMMIDGVGYNLGNANEKRIPLEMGRCIRVSNYPVEYVLGVWFIHGVKVVNNDALLYVDRIGEV